MFEKALALHQKGQLADAAALYRKVLKRNPQNADALHLLGVIEIQSKNALAAIDLFDRAIALSPRNAAFFSNRGAALKELGRLDEALASLENALALQPDYAEALNNRGLVLQDLERFGEALASFERAIATKSDYAEAFYNRGNVLTGLKRPDDAVASYDRALSIRSHYPEALYNRGRALTDLNRFDEALASFNRAIAIAPNYAEALSNRGVVLKELKRLDQALASYDRALAIKPDMADALYNRGMAQLLCGDYRSGFAGYEWRWDAKESSSTPPRIPAPKWRGENISGRRIVVFAEQGLGDTIQFSRYLPLLVERGAKVVFLCPAHLVRLLRPLSPHVEFTSELEGREPFDFRCALMSLPLRFGTELNSVPARVRYLEPEAALVRIWKQRLGDAVFKIGIAWQGKPDGRVDRGRSVPLSEFIPIARLPGARLISLQRGYGLEQLSSLPEEARVDSLCDAFDNGPDAFIDTAAIMDNLDLIITSDTSIAHLAGALGRRTWVALRWVPDWRWLLDRDDSPWYPTMRLFRQQTPGDWGAVFRQITEALAASLSKSDHAKDQHVE